MIEYPIFFPILGINKNTGGLGIYPDPPVRKWFADRFLRSRIANDVRDLVRGIYYGTRVVDNVIDAAITV